MLLAQVLDFGMTDLYEFLDKHRDTHQNDAAELYAAVLWHFYRGETLQLHRIAEANSSALREMRVALALRICLLENRTSSESIQEAEHLSSLESDWTGELAMLLGAIHASQGDRHRARKSFARAAHGFERIGALKKAARAKLNVLVEDSVIDPSSNLLAHYHDLYRYALRKEIRSTWVAGICLLNISREYQILGATSAALRYCERARKLLENEFGTCEYYMTLTHLCHLYLDSGRTAEAKVAYEMALPAPFAEVKAALQVLEAAFHPEKLSLVNSEKMHPTWSERKAQWLQWGTPENPVKLSRIEQRLLRLLAAGPKTKFEIVDLIYGDRLPLDVRLNRFKSLLNTLRRKRPGLIVHKNGLYRLTQSFLDAEAKGA